MCIRDSSKRILLGRPVRVKGAGYNRVAHNRRKHKHSERLPGECIDGHVGSNNGPQAVTKGGDRYTDLSEGARLMASTKIRCSPPPLAPRAMCPMPAGACQPPSSLEGDATWLEMTRNRVGGFPGGLFLSQCGRRSNTNSECPRAHPSGHARVRRTYLHRIRPGQRRGETGTVAHPFGFVLPFCTYQERTTRVKRTS